MLILARKEHERIVIGDTDNQAIVEVIKVRGNRVLLGVEAPEGVRVRRAELTGEPWRRAPKARVSEGRVSESQRPEGQKEVRGEA